MLDALQHHSHLSQDTRAQSIQIGFILLLVMLVAFAGAYQSTVVEERTERIEISHYQQITNDLTQLHEQTRSSTASQPVTINTYITYPTSIFAYPPDHGNTLQTTSDSATISLSNASSTDGLNHLNGSELTYTTKFLQFTPYYAQHDAGTLTLEHGTLTRENGYSPVTDSVIDDNEINLVMLHGDVATTQDTTITAHTRTPKPVRISNTNDDPLTITLDTTLSESKWRSILDDERTTNNGHITDIDYTTDTPYNTVHITLEANTTYELYTYRNTLGSESDSTTAHYLAPTTTEVGVAEGNTKYLIVEVRDKWNRPVSGATLNATTNTGNVEVVDTSNTNGQIRLQYTAPETNEDNKQATIRLALDADPTSADWNADTTGNETITVTIRNTDGSE